MKREPQHMNTKLYKKVIDDCVDLKIKKVVLSFFGEPLMDKQLFERIKYAKNSELKVEFFTNGMLLSKEKTKNIIDSGVDRVFISIDATNPRRYNELRKNGDYNKLVANVEYLLSTRNKTPKVDVGMLILNEKDREDIKTFQKQWKKADEIHIRTPHQWATKPKRKPNLPCYALWTFFAVLSNGIVVPCCMDYEGKLAIGDANKESLKDIWLKSKTLKDLRHFHLNNLADNIPLCKNCDIVESLTDPWWYYD